MLYMIYALDAEDSGSRRLAARPAHLERLHALQAQGRVVLAGPLPKLDAPSTEGGVNGSLIVAEFESLAAARSWFEADPFMQAGVYASFEVRPFLKAV